jgi:hypothetical protein
MKNIDSTQKSKTGTYTFKENNTEEAETKMKGKLTASLCPAMGSAIPAADSPNHEELGPQGDATNYAFRIVKSGVKIQFHISRLMR